MECTERELSWGPHGVAVESSLSPLNEPDCHAPYMDTSRPPGHPWALTPESVYIVHIPVDLKP
jgi:hypothetical protein